MQRPTAADVICAAIWSDSEVLGLPKMIDRFQVQGKSSFVILHQNSCGYRLTGALQIHQHGCGRRILCPRPFGSDGDPTMNRRYDQSRGARLEFGKTVQPA